jgi:hypothetical protein
MNANPLTTLFVSFLLWFAGRCGEAVDQAHAVKVIEGLGGYVHYDFQKAAADVPNTFTSQKSPNVPDVVRWMLGEDFFRRVTMVSLRDTNVVDSDLEVLQRLRRLENLNLSNTGVTSAGLRSLQGRTNLRYLSLWRTQIDDEGLRILADMTHMWGLVLDETLVTDEGLVHLKGLTKLEEWLGITNTLVSDAGLKHLQGMSKLKHLNLRNTFVTRTGAASLRQPLPQADVSFDIFSSPSFEHQFPLPNHDEKQNQISLSVMLNQQLVALDRICGLTAEQKQKLRLFGRGDIARLVKPGSGPIQEPFGPFRNGSHFIRFLETSLTPDQVRSYEPFRELFRSGVHVQVWLNANKHATSVRLNGEQCTDTAVMPLRGLPDLQRLVLFRTAMTEAGLLQLKEIKKLQELWIAGTAMSDQTTALLQQALPGLKIIRK